MPTKIDAAIEKAFCQISVGQRQKKPRLGRAIATGGDFADKWDLLMAVLTYPKSPLFGRWIVMLLLSDNDVLANHFYVCVVVRTQEAVYSSDDEEGWLYEDRARRRAILLFLCLAFLLRADGTGGT